MAKSFINKNLFSGPGELSQIELLRRLNLLLDQVDSSLVGIVEPSGVSTTLYAVDSTFQKTQRITVKNGQITAAVTQ